MNPSAAFQESGQPPVAVNPSSQQKLGSLAILTGLWLAIYFAGMFSPPLLDDVDALHAEASREMLIRHDWVTLYTDGFRYLEKAPLMYWATAVSYELFGISDWSTRLPLMLGILAFVLATYRLGAYAFGERGGFYSALALVTSIGPYIFTRFLIPDVLVGLWLVLSFDFFLRSLEEERPSRFVCWGFAAVCALNVLTKGLIGLIFPFATIGIFLLLTGRLKHVLKLQPVSSTLIFLALAAPWHILAAIRNPAEGQARGFLWFYFVNEHIMRFLNKRVPAGYDTVPLFLFWGFLVLWLMPWAVFLPQAIKQIPASLKHSRLAPDRRSQANFLFFLWALVILLFFSFSTRQEYYTIPALPGIALLTGGWLAQEAEGNAEKARKAGRVSSLVLMILGILGGIVGLIFFSATRPAVPGADLADLLRKNPQDYDFSLGHVLDFTPQALGMFRGPLLGASVSLLVGTILNWWMRRRNRPVAGNAVLALMMIALLTCVHTSFVTFSPILSSHDLAVAISQKFQPGDVIVVDGPYHEASTLNFYTHIPLRVLHEPSGNLWYGAKFPDAPHVFETQQSFTELWRAPFHVFLWTDQDDPKELAGMPHFLLARSGGKAIFVNRTP
ncbi:MAG TPA: glycosyltransferase family 39 protein [Candidatus Sulfotelmatobacter sp.]|nr:glycosyltransferase family 39 protein [Candidatus Sulfotelmatobacter sp.]